jgi:hypothetical protein
VNIGLIIAIVAVIALIGGGIFFLTSGDDDDTSAEGGATTEQGGDGSGDLEAGPPTQPPTGSPEFDDLAQSCYEGDMRSCDQLFNETPVGSDYEAYGDTCGGRWPISARPSCTQVITDPLPPED